MNRENFTVWFDVVNAPHALLFYPLIKLFSETGFKVLVTTREYGYLTGLLDNLGLEYHVFSCHGGKQRGRKLVLSMERTRALGNFIKSYMRESGEIKVLVSKSSPEAVVAASVFKTPIVTAYENEHNRYQCKLTFPLSNCLVIPSVFPVEKLMEFGADGYQEIHKFYGTFEVSHVKYFTPSTEILQRLNLSGKEKIVVVRPEPYQSSYFSIEKRPLLVPLLKKILPILKEYEAEVFVFPRSPSQAKQVKNLFKESVKVLNKPVDSLSLMNYSSLFLGGGGTMTREAALLGVPTLSFYPGPLLSVDKLLINEKLVFHSTEPKQIISFTRRALDEGKKRKPNLAKFTDPLQIIKDKILQYLSLGGIEVMFEKNLPSFPFLLKKPLRNVIPS